MTPASYEVHYACHVCGQTHAVLEEVLIPGGPSEAGCLDELYPDGDLPASVERLLGELVWCDQAAEPIELEDPAGVYLVPRIRPVG